MDAKRCVLIVDASDSVFVFRKLPVLILGEVG
jgi:hypothetical protein